MMKMIVIAGLLSVSVAENLVASAPEGEGERSSFTPAKLREQFQNARKTPRVAGVRSEANLLKLSAEKMLMPTPTPPGSPRVTSADSKPLQRAPSSLQSTGSQSPRKLSQAEVRTLEDEEPEAHLANHLVEGVRTEDELSRLKDKYLD